MIFSTIGGVLKKGVNYYTRFASALTRGLDSSVAGLTDAVSGTLGIIQHATLGRMGPEYQKTADLLLKNELGNTMRQASQRQTREIADAVTGEETGGESWERVTEMLGGAGGHLAAQGGLALATGGASVPAQIGAQVLFNGAVSAGIQSVRKYNEAIGKGEMPASAADKASLVGVQSFGVGALEGGVDALLLGLTKWVPPVRNVPALAALRKIGERMPRAVRVGGAALGGAVGEGLAEGLADVAYEDIYSAADRGEMFDPARATRSLFSDPAMQKQFFESFALGAVIGGGLKGAVSLAETSPVVATEFVAKVNEEGAYPELAEQLAYAPVEEQRETVTTALYRAVANKNADLPDWATYAAITRSGKKGTVDDVLRKVMKREEFIEDSELGTVSLPTKAEVMAEVVEMDATGRAMEEGEAYRAVRQEQERVAEEALLQRPQEVLRASERGVETRPGVDGRFSLADFNLQRIRGKEITPPEVWAARTQGFEGVYTDTGESLIFDDARVRKVLGDNAVKEAQEQHRAQFREKIFEKVPSLREAEVAFVDGLVNGVGLGAYFEGEGRIEISKDNERWNTLAHEGAHHYFDTGLDTAGQNRVVRAIQAEYGQEVQEMVDKHFISQKEAVKEVFAEKFSDWAATDAAPTTFLERVWAKLRDILRDIVESPELRRVYRDFARGEGRLEMARADAVADGMGEQKVVERMREAFYDNGLQLPLYQRGDEDAVLSDKDYDFLDELRTEIVDDPYINEGLYDPKKMAQSNLGASKNRKILNSTAEKIYDYAGKDIHRAVFLAENMETIGESGERNANIISDKIADKYGEKGVLYQRGEDGSAELMGQVARRVEARDGVVPSAAVVRKELLKGLLAYRATEPVKLGDISYYPVYINVGDGKFEKGMPRGTMMAGWFSMRGGAVTGVGVRKWAEGTGRGDVRFDSQDPVMYEKVGDVLMEHLDAEGMTVVEWQATGKVADKIGEYLRVQKGGPVLHTNKRWDEILEMIDAKKSNWKLPRWDDTLYQRDDSSWNDLLNALGAGSSKFELRKEVDKIRKREEKFGDMQTRFPSGTHAIGDVAESWTKAVNGAAEGAVSGYVVAVERRSDGDQYWIADRGIANKEQASEIAEKIAEIGDVSIAERIDLIRKIANDVAVEGAFDKWAVMTVRTPMEKPLYQRGVLEVQRDWAVMPLDEGGVGDDAPLYQRAKLGAKQAQWVKEAGLTEANDLTQNEQAQVALTGQEVAAPSKSKGLGIAVRGVVRRVPDVLRKFGDDLWGRYQRFAHLNETFRTTRLRDIDWESFVKGYNRMGKDGKLVQRAFDIAFMNNDVDKVLEMAGEYDFQDSVVALREDLEQLWHEIDGRGLDIGWLKGYLPRFIKQKNFTAEDAFVALETVKQTKDYGRSLRRHASNLRDRAVAKIDNENIDNYVSPIEAVEGYYSAIGGLLGTMEFFGHRSLQEYGDLALSDTGREYFDEWLFNKERPTIFSTPESIAEKKGELMEDWAGKIRYQKGKMGNQNQPRVGRAERAPVTDEDALREVFLKEMSAFLVEDRSPRGWLEDAYDNFKRFLGDDLEIDRENKIVNITKSVVNTRDRLLWEGKFKDTNSLEELMETLKGVFEPLPFSWRAWGATISEARMFSYGILLGSPLRIPRDLISLIHIGLRPDSKGWSTLGRAMKQLVTPERVRGRPLLTPKELGLDSYMAEFYAHERGGGWFSRAGEKVFTFTGMRSVDDLRRVLSNEASIIEMSDYLARHGDEAFIEKFDVRHLVPEEQVAGVVEDVRKGRVTPNVGILLFAQEGMIIPNSQYQAPVMHKHPVARATTMLLGEAIHETNFMFNKALKQVEDHGALGGSLRILVAILLPYLLAGVSTEYLVTAIRQKRLPQAHEMPIFVMDTIARLLFTSRWDIRSLTDGDFTAFAQGFIPALGAYSAPVDSVLRLGMGAASDDPEKVTRAIDKGLRKIPIVGDPWYSWFSDTAADDVKKYEDEVGRSAGSAFRYWLGAPEKKKKVRGLTSGRGRGGGLGGLDSGLGDLGDLDFLDLDIGGLSL